MNIIDRENVGIMKGILQEAFKTAERDYNIASEPEEARYYAGLSDGYKHAYELVRKLK